MHKDSKRTCRTIFLHIKPFIWRRSRCRRRRGLLKLSNLANNGSQKSGRINGVAVLKGFVMTRFTYTRGNSSGSLRNPESFSI